MPEKVKRTAVSFLNSEYQPCKLIELSSELETIVKSNKYAEFYIRGGDQIDGSGESSSHLITEFKSFKLTNVHTSNSLLYVVPDFDKDCAYVEDIMNSYLTVDEINPRMFKHLISRFITLHENCTVQQLESTFPVAKRQLVLILAEIGAYQNQATGSLSILPLAQITELLAYVVNSAIVDNMSLESISLKRMEKIVNVDGIPDAAFTGSLLQHVLSLVSRTKDNEVYSVDGERLSAYFGMFLLHKYPHKTWEVREFLEAWSNSLPLKDEFSVSLEMLRDNFVYRVVDTFSNSEHKSLAKRYIFPIQRDLLSLQPIQRLHQMFQRQPKWYEDDIRLLLEDLTPSKVKIDQILLKFTRLTKTADQMVVCTSRLS